MLFERAHRGLCPVVVLVGHLVAALEVQLERVQRETLCVLLALVLAFVLAQAQPLQLLLLFFLLLLLFLLALALRGVLRPALPQLADLEQDPVQRVLDGRRLVQGLAVAGAERERGRGLPLGLRFSSFRIVFSVSL